ncbi:dihydroxyacetone kinase subunit DhaK [Anaerocolumna aminovalerica]|uniref:dihydroxyacetone kinase subunit DhaK n=1 Tax=Anaerocolumna aminovalerica TaxID=1527 RepID=UPI001C0E98CF|nr:dihydroxyacetone kinase subunit DhaK [Anaerocolumna aminovalerica]MBU5332346.1 dihydroxyacetone kinase subunit DhaK [Anaerocolumna aminovalerica]
MKKLINKPETVVREMCHGIALAHPELELIAKHKIIRRKVKNLNKVSLISGGGSGHEPAHAGFVGEGMLDAAVCGDVFASPSQIQVYHAIRETATKQGVLLIVKNYSGDIMNFKNAAYMAQEDGILVDYVKVDDDIAVQDSLYTVGRRGVAGTVLVHKIAGGAAEQGKSLAEVKRLAEKAIDNVKSLGFALSSCTVPAKGTPTFVLEEDKMEYGVGIHGEPGIQRSNVMHADELANKMIDSLCKELALNTSLEKQRVAVLINGFGATPLMELYLLNASVGRELADRGITIARTFVGNYMTSIDMAGASISIMKLDEELEELLNQPCITPAIKIDGPCPPSDFFEPYEEPEIKNDFSYEVETSAEYAAIGEKITLENIIYIIDVMSESIIRNEVPFCELDAHAGDGDFGMSVAKGFKQLKKEWNSIINTPGLTIGSFLNACSLVIMEYCGGASGPIWGSAFRAAGRHVMGKQEMTIKEFASMLQAVVKGIQSTGERSFGRGAVVGDKTLMDALIPCADSWSDIAERTDDFTEAFRIGAAAAVEGAKKTEQIIARMGRAGTVGERSIGYPDAGAHALGVVFTEISQLLKGK